MDRASGGPVMVGSPMGGMDIEEVAETDPDQIHKVHARQVFGNWNPNFQKI